VFFVFASIDVLYYIYRFGIYIYRFWDEVDLVMVDDLSDVLLDLICHYLIEDFLKQCSLRRLDYSSPFGGLV
jgi:hypothetical protein